MKASIDHFMYAVPNLDHGIKWAEDTFGVTPKFGGVHVGLGTQNALLSLGDTYLELIAPDPEQDLRAHNLGSQFSRLSMPGLVTWAVEANLKDIATTLTQLNIQSTDPIPTQRKTAEGELLEWSLLFPNTGEHGGRLPFFIDWQACAHPKDTNPLAGAVTDLKITSPNAQQLNQLFSHLDLDIQASQGEADMTVYIETDRGQVTLKTTPETVGIYNR